MAETFSLKDLETLAHRFASTHLDDYNIELSLSEAPIARKEINDALWGTISLTPIEVAIIDSPLLQRLRYVRQLGVVHWVYPGAGHTRFEHTLGVLHQVHNLTQALNALGLQKSIPNLISASNIQLLRLCALLHDVGHTAFSHVSEKALEAVPGVAAIPAQFSKAHRTEDRKISEVFAFFLVRSPSVKQLLSLLIDKYGSIEFSKNRAENLDQVIDKLSRAIIGQKIDDRLPLLHELISGPFDADKLDYYVRDAREAGTPSVLDISRLVQKITIKELDARNLPAEIGKSVGKIEGHHYLFGIKWSGVAMLDELHLARVLLYAKIYRHSKVVAIEQMLRGALLTLAPISSAEALFELVYFRDDEVLLGLNVASLASALKIPQQNVKGDIEKRLTCACNIFRDIKARRLVVKAFEVQRRYPADQIEQDQDQKNALTDLRERIDHPEQREQFRVALINEVERILKITDSDRVPSRVHLESSILVHYLGQIPGGSQIARAYLLPSSGRPVLFREYTVNRAAWADAYMSDQPIGFVFAPPRIADAVYVAIEKLVRIDHNLNLPSAAMEASKRDQARISRLKSSLHAAGYYRGAPFDIRPIPARLKKADIEVTVEELAGRLAAYHEPRAADAGRGLTSIPHDRIVGWLRQFDDDDHVECALQLIKKLRFIGRPEAVAALKTFVEKNQKFRGAVVVPFGNARDSGAVQTYFAADVIGTHVKACTTLEEAARLYPNDPLIFVDDFIGSGGQGQDILAAGFGLSSLRRDLNENRDMFDEQIQVHLKRSKIGFVFTAAWDEGLKTIRSVTKELELDATMFQLLTEKDLPFAFENCLLETDSAIVKSFQAACEQIGKTIIGSMVEADGKTPPDKRKQKIDERMLGYGNRAMLLATPFNVPTQTLTLLWGEGMFDGVPWSPLLLRRKKT